LDVLAGCDLVLAEDTRVAGKLLSAYGLSAKLERYDEHGAERTRPRALAPIRATLIFFEGGSRLAASLADMAATLGPGREAVVCRELTKLYETFYRGRLGYLAERSTSGPWLCGRGDDRRTPGPREGRTPGRTPRGGAGRPLADGQGLPHPRLPPADQGRGDRPPGAARPDARRGR